MANLLPRIKSTLETIQDWLEFASGSPDAAEEIHACIEESERFLTPEEKVIALQMARTYLKKLKAVGLDIL